MAKFRAIATLHPSYVMVYGSNYIPVVISDLKKGTNEPPEYYNLVPTLEDVRAFSVPRFAFDIETNIFTNEITMVGISATPYKVMVVPFRGAYVAEIRRIFAEARQVIGHNIISFDLPHLEEAGVKLSPDCQIWDTILMWHLISPDSPEKNLEFVSSIFTQKPDWKHLVNENKELYCARDVDVTLQAFQQMLPILNAQNLTDLYKYTQVPLAKICHLIETQGIHTSGGRATKVRQEILAEIAELEKTLPEGLAPYDKSIRVRQLAPEGTLGKSGKPIKFIHAPGTERITPWTSTDSVSKWLYDTSKLPEQYHSKTKKLTTDKTALEKLQAWTGHPNRAEIFAETHKGIVTLRRLRTLEELATGFIKGMKDDDGNEIPIRDGKINPRFFPYGTNSGRLSSAKPNMQNQPELARYIYVPSQPDWCFVEADFSQGENRLTAWYANDQERLARLSVPGFSEHKLNAEIFFGIPMAEVKKDNSREAPYGKAKALTHGINYGEGAGKIANNLGIPQAEVREYLFKWRAANQPTVHWMDNVSKQAAREGLLTTVFTRKRWFWSDRLYSESLSFLPQSTLADISFRAMIGLMYERIHWPLALTLQVSPVVYPLPYPARLLLQVHDSLLVECPAALVSEVVRAMKACMEQPWTQLGGFSIPAEFKVGNPGASWGELKPYKEGI